jgi:hypothetical protein
VLVPAELSGPVWSCNGQLCAPSPITLAEAAEDWLQRATAGVVRTRSGDAYKPAAIRAYRHALDCRILPHFGDQRLSALSGSMLQDFVDELLAAGRSPSTIRNALLPVRAIYRRALQRGEVAVNPTLKLVSDQPVSRRTYASAMFAALRSSSSSSLICSVSRASSSR